MVRLETEHVNSIATFVKEAIILLYQLARVIKESLRIERVREKVEWQDGLNQDAVQPKSCVFLVDNLQDADQDLLLVLVVDLGPVSLMVSHHD